MTDMKPIVPAWRRYGPALDIIYPGRIGEERMLRCKIMLMRDRAMRSRNGASWEAEQVLLAIGRIAAEHCTNRMSIEKLKDLHNCLVRMVMAANNLQTWADPATWIEPEAINADG